MGTVHILWFFLVLRNFWVGTVKKTTLYVKELSEKKIFVFRQIELPNVNEKRRVHTGPLKLA